MFCSNCGNQIESGSRFCPICGAEQEIAGMGKEFDGTVIKPDNGGLFLGMSVIDLMICITEIILAVLWTSKFFSNLKICWENLRYSEFDVKFMGILLLFLPYAFLLCLCIVGVLCVRKKQYHTSLGVIICVLALFFKITSIFYSYPTENYSEFKAVIYYMISGYGTIGIFTIVFGLIVAVLSYAKSSGNSSIGGW